MDPQSGLEPDRVRVQAGIRPVQKLPVPSFRGRLGSRDLGRGLGWRNLAWPPARQSSQADDGSGQDSGLPCLNEREICWVVDSLLAHGDGAG